MNSSDGIGNLTAPNLDTKALIEAARISFQIVEPWAEAKSENTIVTDIILLLQKQAESFYDSIHCSYNNAQSGYTFAGRAEGLCTSLLEPSDIYSDAEIREYISEMQIVAEKAHKEAIETANLFRSNRRGFNSITARIPIVRDKIGGEKAEIEASGTRAGRRAEGWERLVDRLTPISGKRKTKTPQSSLHIAGTLISLPVTIPMLILAGSGATVFSAQAKDRQRQLLQYEDAIKTLDSAVEKLQELMQQMDVLAEYWREMKTVLKDVHGRLNEVRNDVILRLKIEDLKRDWKKVESDYLEYMKELAMLKDFSQMHKHIASSSMT